jgi:hypothetical protein
MSPTGRTGEMRRIRIVGICLVAAFAVGAVVAASASAAPRPTYKTCFKVSPKGSGRFDNKECTKESKGGKMEGDYELGEWNQGKEASPKVKGTNGIFTLTSYIKGIRIVGSISCTKGKWVGNVTGPSQSTVTATLEKCTTSGEVCTSKGAKTGDIVTNPLSATLILIGKEPVRVGVLIKAAAEGGALAEFSCGAESIRWFGSVDGEESENVGKVSKQATSTFAVNAGGEQVVNSEEGGTKGEDVLLLESLGVGTFETGLNFVARLKGEEMEVVPA